MAIILDLILLVILAVSVLIAYKKGFIKTLFSLVGGLVAIVLAITLSTPVGDWLSREYIAPTIRNAVLTKVNGSDLTDNYEKALESVDVVGKLREMPEGLQRSLKKFNVDIDEIVSSAEESKSNMIEEKERLIDRIAIPVSDTIGRAIALIVLFVLLFIALLLVTKLLDAVFRVLPFGKKVNKVGGIILGVIRGLLIIMIFGAVVYGLAAGNIIVSATELDNTILLKAFNKLNPILNILK